MRAFALVICSALALTGCTTVVVETVPSETRTLSPIELQNQTNQFECNELNLVFEAFYVETLWGTYDTDFAATFAEPFSERKNKTAYDISRWMNLAINAHKGFVGPKIDLMWGPLATGLYQDIQEVCSDAGIPLLGVPWMDDNY